jgi:predicted RNase H-like HicB family nuclease
LKAEVLSLGRNLLDSAAELCASIPNMNSLKLVIEKHSDGFVSYPLGLKGVVIGQGDTYDQALADVRSAIEFHIETFGPDAFETDSPVLEAFIAETKLAA